MREGMLVANPAVETAPISLLRYLDAITERLFTARAVINPLVACDPVSIF
jgi:hypothetical protein